MFALMHLKFEWAAPRYASTSRKAATLLLGSLQRRRGHRPQRCSACAATSVHMSEENPDTHLNHDTSPAKAVARGGMPPPVMGPLPTEVAELARKLGADGDCRVVQRSQLRRMSSGPSSRWMRFRALDEIETSATAFVGKPDLARCLA